ncbi:cation-dependent mannose-6-phosphate receptor-like [Aricia agestis]|uniref:cation-dependent mannose-6-phosphate receptor-like n=1 Tax=Aricia agestis TaxID=91739 RepID=UPI001C2036B6|nr:cation-dependent mannose-6-phosphate receptor-like [Aricia agestis]
MMDVKNISLLSFVYLALIFSTSAQDVCTKKGPCSCEFSNGTGIDLSPSGKAFYTTQTYELKNNGTQYALSTYFYHPCHDELPQLNSTTTGTCNVPLSICRHVNKMTILSNTTYKGEETAEFMGSSNVTDFSTDGKSLIYYNGPSSTVVMLVCAQTPDQLSVYSLAEPNKIVLSFYSENACLKQIEEHGRSVGSTLCIIFFSCVVFYLVLGICTKKFLMGAVGVEVIPNLVFWSDLPNLVKDGWSFALNGFKLPARSAGPVTSPDPNSYDSI